MTVESTVARNDYIGTGAVSTYDYDFKIYDETDLLVTKRLISTGDETTLSYPTDYSVTGVGNEEGGTITLTAGALASTYALTVRFRTTITQETDLRNQGGYHAESVEDALDRLTRIAQQLDDEVDRCIRFGETFDVDGEITDVTDGGYLRIDGNRIVTASAVNDSGSVIEAGTGAVSRTVTARLTERISAAAYSTLAQAIAYAAATGKQLVFPAGTYSIPAEIAATLQADQHWIALGRVTLQWSAGAAGSRMIYLTSAGYDFLMEGLFTLSGADLARDCMRIDDAAVGLGNVSIFGAEFRNAYSSLVGTGSNGLIIVGGFSHVRFEEVGVYDISRAAGVGVPGSQGSIGLGCAQSGSLYAGHVEAIDCRVVGVTSAEADGAANNVDCDGLSVTGPSGSSFSNEHPSSVLLVRGGRFEDNRGRHIKAQRGHVDVSGAHFIRDTYKTIAEGNDIDIQYGQGRVRGTRHFYNNIAAATPFGSSFAAISASITTDTTVAGALTVEDVLVTNNYPTASGDMPYFLALSVGAGARWRSVAVKGCDIMGSGRLSNLVRIAGSGNLTGSRMSVCENYMARLSSHLINSTPDIAGLRLKVEGNHSDEGTLRDIVHSDSAGGVPIVSGHGNVGFNVPASGAHSGLTETGEALRTTKIMGVSLRDGGAIAIETLSLADDASGAFTKRNYQTGIGIYMISANTDRLCQGMFAHDGTALDLLAGVSTAITYGDAANPDVDGDLNVWKDGATHAINVKNRLGSARVITLVSFG